MVFSEDMIVGRGGGVCFWWDFVGRGGEGGFLGFHTPFPSPSPPPHSILFNLYALIAFFFNFI